MDITKISADTLALSSGLTQDAFAKTNLISLLAKKSALVRLDRGTAALGAYYFTGTRTDADGITHFEGGAARGKTLSEILSLPARDRSVADNLALAAFSRATDFLLAQDTCGGAVGAGGVIVSADEETETAEVLLIDPEIFETCAQNHKAAYADIQGKFLHKGLDARSSLIFTRAVVAYKSLTGHFPFDNDDTTKRQEDIFDANFIPLPLWDAKINAGLAGSIDAALHLSAGTELLAGRRSISDAREERRRQKLLERAQEFDSSLFKDELARLSRPEDPSESADERILSQKRASLAARTRRKLLARRFLRRNKSRLLAIIVPAVLVAWLVSGVVRENAGRITTVSLTSAETAHALYAAIHRADVPDLQEIVTGRETKGLILKVSGFYVSSRQRLEASPDNGTLTPEEWFTRKKTPGDWMLGITNLTIDGEPLPVDARFPKKKDRPLPISEEDGEPLRKGIETERTAEYFLVRQTENRILTERMTDTVTLRWSGRKWLVTRVDGKSRPTGVRTKDFIADYEEAASSSASALEAAEALRGKYGWIPGKDDLLHASEERRLLNAE